MTSAVGAAKQTVGSQWGVVPRRIILSRKGWDSSAGGFASPILESGFPLSIPIPDGNSGIKYGDLYSPDGRKIIGEMVRQLSKGRWTPDDEVHLDPDIRQNALKRESFRAAFGQSGPFQSHLRNQDVHADESGECNDLFLFFGRYREVDEVDGQWSYKRGSADVQLVFGWLQIGEIIPLANGIPAWAKHHPHCRRSDIVRAELGKLKVDNNTLYAARGELTFCKKPGAGVFPYFDVNNADPKRLTCPEGPASRWRLPEFFFRGDLKPFSNIGKKAAPLFDDDACIIQRRGRGQEFVLETKGRERETLQWLNSLFATS